MRAVRYFDVINLAFCPREAIYRRLGYRRSSTHLSQVQRDETERYIREAEGMIRLQGAALRLPVRLEKPDRIILADDMAMISGQLAAFLGDSREIALMGATGGNGIMEAIRQDTAGDRVTRAVVLDAAASEIVDAALDWVMTYFNRELRREGKSLLNARYSAGYGDLALENQRLIHRLLGMERFGVSLTETCILMPEKSVTAITGIVEIGHTDHITGEVH